MRRRELLEWMGAVTLLGGCARDVETPRAAPRPPQPPPAPPPAPALPEASSAPRPEATPATEADWARLAGSLDGSLVRPGAAGYDDARRVFNPRFDAVRPQGVVRAASEADVQRAIAFSRAHVLPFATRSGGHSYAGYSTGTGLVCDVRPLGGVRLDGGHARVGAGTALVDLYASLAPAGVAIPGGSCPSVGISGLAMGGGQGVLGRALGLTCDSVRALRLVTADGALHECDAERDADLYWACRGGGGGNFGVLTSLTFDVHPIGALTRFSLPYAWDAAADVIAAWQEWGPSAPDALWSKCEIGARQGRASISVDGVFVGEEAALAGELATIERRVGARPRARRVETASFLDMMLYQAGCARRSLEECRPRPEGTLGRSTHVSRSDVFHASLAPAGITALVAAMDACAARPDGWGRVGLDALGGAIGRPAPDATAFVHRRARFIAQYATYSRPRAPDEVVQAGVRWLDDLHAALRPHASGFAYQNYIDPRLGDWPRAYYGANLPRLQAIKSRVDPDDFFHFAQSIPLA